MQREKPDIRHLFEPRSVAVIGASPNPTKIGNKIVQNILSDGYTGQVHPVNPKGGEIRKGLPIHRSLEEIEGEVDLATIVIPEGGVFPAVEACAAKGVKYLSIITSGFSEVGNIEAERRIVGFAHDHGMRVLGPNIFGIYSSRVSLNATFGPGGIRHGKVAIITQSGALGIAMIGKTAVENIGLSAIVSVGNKADIDEADLLEYLVAQEETEIILMYIEGVQDGQRLIEALKAATRVKPIIVIKSGRSQRGAIAAASHTGSLAGADEVFDAIMGQCGVLRAESLKDAFNWCKYFAQASLPRGDHGVIVTNGGGIGVLATDACEKYGVGLYDDAATLKEIFSPVTPDFGSTKNPVDITGQATGEDYDRALGAALEHPDIHAVMGLYCETALFDVESLTTMIRESQRKYREAGKPVIFSIIGGSKIDASIQALREDSISVFDDVYEAVSCLGAMVRFKRHQQEATAAIDEASIDLEAVGRAVASARADNRQFLLPGEAKVVMDAVGMPMPKTGIARNLGEAVELAGSIGYPVVMKIVSKDIIHKSDAGGIALDLEDEGEVIDAYQAILHNARRYNPNAKITGVEVAEMIKARTEVIVGARRDPAFGPVVMFGLGGIYVEVMKDVSFRAYPLDRREARAMVREIRSYPLLLGVRGEKRKDIEGVIDTIIKMGTLIRDCEAISDIELNPVVVYDQGDGVKALDVRILLNAKKER
jgi:acetyl coenzyme A synthetase (ADP forming)-like protein